MKLSPFVLPLALLMVSACSQAEPPTTVTKTAISADANMPQIEAAIRGSIKEAIPDAEVTSIKTTPFQGLYEVKAKGYGTAYMSADGRYMVQGELIELRGKQVINVTEQGMAGDRQKALAAIDKKDQIIFPATGQTKGVVYVFTDVDCGYCRKLHMEIPQINQLGIEVRYLAFPRSGYPSPMAKRMEAIWCSANPREALTLAKQGQNITAPECKSPVKAQYDLGQDLGVRGTPAVFLESGMQVGGYLSPKDLAAAMNIR
ncbi:thioredoxin fold domain-containing protein [Agitococcus lubricus]|uniref:Thiol:disulfide interchange protein n=1 Tax=Agitococcus lubricus TaxID=1077255 RepID=A0A2T5IYM2_9GAMM|nr:thioredoxin fold domain-containing protein [Agitococcus lubricus]PTQ89091.1 thiol:disulfide interchange protein DsbC [Agitococcus lubricus]